MHTLSSGSNTHTLSWCTAEETAGPVQAVGGSLHLSSSSSVTVGLTMPQRTQHCLVHVLLLWTIVLSIMQVVFVIFYFTVGRQISSDHDFGKGKMLTFQAIDDKGRTKWLAKNPDPNLVLEGYNLTIQRDGYYFLNLQVTLNSCEKEHTVTLKRDKKILLEGLINTTLCSTGLLGKVEELSAGWTLEVAINPEPKNSINLSDFATHLDIIYMLRP